MSIPVQLTDLASAMSRYHIGYLLTASDSGPPRAVQIRAVLQDGDLVLDSVGRRTRENVVARSAVSLLWPPSTANGYSLIVDGQAVVEGETLRITPDSAVLHRSNPPQDHSNG